MRRIAFGAVAIALLAAPGASRDLDDVPAAVPAGPLVACISLRSLGSSPARNDRVIDFITRGGRVYRNTLPRSCPSLGFERAFSYEQQERARVCEHDLVRVINSADGTRGAGCALGPFQPVTLTPARR